MGQLVTTVVGGIAGFMIGGPMGAQIGMMLGGMIGATLFGPTIYGPRLNDLKVTASTYGVAIPEIYGTVRIGGNLIWTSGIKETKKSSRAGKGGPKQTTYTYDATFAMGLCKGEVDDVLRIWADSKLIYDNTAGATRKPQNPLIGIFKTIFIDFFSSKKKKKTIKMRLYRGSEDQLPDSLIEANEGVGNVSGHRGMAYVVFEKLQLEDFGNRIPQLTFEVTKSRTKGVLAVSAKDADLVVEDTANRDWLPDFEAGRVLSFNKPAANTYLYDVSTMAQQGVKPLPVNLTNAYSMMAGANTLLVNNYPAGVGITALNVATLSSVAQFHTCSGLTNTFNEATGAVNLSTTGRLGHGRYLSGEVGGYHMVHTDWMGMTYLMNESGQLLSQIQAPFSPSVFLEGRRDLSSSQIIGWRAANNRLEMFVLSTPASAAYTTIADGGDTAWVPYTGYTMQTINLQPYPGHKFQPMVVLYDPTDDHIFCLGHEPGATGFGGLFGNLFVEAIVFKYSLATGTYKFLKTHNNVVPPRDCVQNMRASRLAGGTFGWIGKFTNISEPIMAQVSLQTGELVSYMATDDEFGRALGGAGDQYWDDATDSIFASRTEGGVTNAYRIVMSDNVASISIPQIVEDVCLRNGILTTDDIDLTELNDGYVVGYSIDRLCTSRDALKQIATAFLFDAYESDYKLKFRSRGGDPIADIPEDWIARPGDDGILKETLTQELEMPLRIAVNYYDVERDHQQNSQSAKRKANPFPTMWTAKEDVIDLPMSWDADSAKQCADKLLKMAWANRTGYSFSLPWRYLKYDPTDCVTITRESGTTYNLRLTDANIGADFTVEAQAVSESATAYVSDASGVSAESPQQHLDGDGSAYPMIINTPLLRDEDYDTTSMATCYVSAGTIETTFSGTAIYMDNGVDYQAVGVISGQTTSGYTVSALPPTTSYEATDEETVLKVRLSDPSMELESITQEDMLNYDGNAAIVGGEVIQFRDAVQQLNGEWWLSGLLRARRGTNYAVRDHTAGERFLMIDSSSVVKFIRPPESYFTTRSFKAAPLSVSLADVVPTSETLIPRDLMPYTPEAFKISDDGTDVTMTAERRSRVSFSLRDSIGLIHYREGDVLSARMVFKVWAGKDLSDVNSVGDPTTTLSVPMFDSAGQDIAITASFPLLSLLLTDKALIKITEMGEVEGIPKWIAAERLGANQWNLSELY